MSLWGGAVQLLDAQAAAHFADALRSNSTLTTLQLYRVDIWRDAAAAASLFGALTGHPSLTSIGLWDNDARGIAVAAGTLLGALVAADAPLVVLDVSCNQLGDAGLGPLVDACRTTRTYESWNATTTTRAPLSRATG